MTLLAERGPWEHMPLWSGAVSLVVAAGEPARPGDVRGQRALVGQPPAGEAHTVAGRLLYGALSDGVDQITGTDAGWSMRLAPTARSAIT